MMLKKITGPGFFRLFLALAVFVHHTTRFAVGSSAVYIFFSLSGYWIYKMYIDRYSKTMQPLITYTISRIWRLLPTFWLVTCLTFLYLIFVGSLASYWDESGKAHFIISNLFIFGYNTLQRPPIVPGWSLDIEMQFYVLAPFLAMLFAWRKISPAWLLLGFAAISLASYLLHNPVSLMDYLVYFAVGMTAACADWRPSGKLVLGFLGAAALGIFVCIASPWRGVLLLGAHPGPHAIYNPHLNVVLALLMVPYAIYTTRQPGSSRDGMFADLSYIVYLLHWAGAMWINSHTGSAAHRLSYMAVGWVVVIGLSLLIWKFYDRPINRMRSRWVSKRKIAAYAKPIVASSS
jgi:peptidoglycan/LPS O-acetylase OafA/YrhL